jgi:hypothetical protein
MRTNLKPNNKKPKMKRNLSYNGLSLLIYDQGPIGRAHETRESFELTVIGSQEPPRRNFNPNKTKA